MIRPNWIVRQLYPRVFWRGDKADKAVYLTFDDGPIPEVTPWVLTLLKQYNAKATFFCVGQNIEKHHDVFQQLIDQGHQVGNHTYDHIVEWRHPWSVYQQSIAKAQRLMNTTLFRPPHGKIVPWRISSLKKQFTKVVMWDVLSYDFDVSLTSEQVYNNVINHVRNGSVIVFHDSLKAWPHLQVVLPKVLEWMQNNGYQFKVIDN